MKTINLQFFTGFYNSIHDEAFDRELEYICEENNCTTENLNFTCDFQGYSKGYVNAVNNELDLSLEFEALESPKYYNYSTDKIYCKINEADIAKIASVIDTPEFLEVLKDTFTSCSGFVSFYSNNITDWKAKPITEYDEIELGALLQAYMLINAPKLDMQAYEYCNGNGYATIDYKVIKKA